MKASRVTSSLWCAFLIIVLHPSSAHAAENVTIIQASEVEGGYQRSLFKHWIDGDGDGCDTRKEVLIAEAIVKPIIGKGCSLSGGTWLSAYDGKKIANSSDLDIDHVVPLAEAWRSGAWAWTSEQRMAFANDLTDPNALIAVTASTNRAKGDRGPAQWLPEINRCDYIQSWVGIKIRYALTFDPQEVSVIKGFFTECKNLKISSQVLNGFSVTLNGNSPKFQEIQLMIKREVEETRIPASVTQVKLYGKCQKAGARGRLMTGESVICKRIAKDSTLKWRR